MKTVTLIVSILFFICACEIKSKNEVDKMYLLLEVSELMVPLDSMSPPKPQNIQFLEDDGLLTFFNPYNNKIYRYNFQKKSYENAIFLNSEGENGISRPVGYHIMNEDSIFVFDMGRNELVMIDENGIKKSSISLIENASMSNTDWALTYPQFFPKTSTPILKVNKNLVLTGFFAWAIPEEIIETFKFTAIYDLGEKQLSYRHQYPQNLYGSEFNWDDPFYTTVYYDWNPDQEKMVYSFPVSNILFEGKLSEDILKEKQDSKIGLQILKPLKARDIDRQSMLKHLIESDLYASIKYDKFRKVYYRVLLEGIPYSKDFRDLSNKSVTIQMLNSEGEVLHQERLGDLKNWNYENIFVSKEGVFMEYVDTNAENEDFLQFKLFNFNKL